MANPSPPIAGLTNPSGTRAAIRACSSGLLDGASSRTTASRGRRCASAEKTSAEVSGSCVAAGASAGSDVAADDGRSRGASRAASSAHVEPTGASTTSSATLRCASSGSSVTTATLRAWAVERPRRERVLAERRRADDEDGVERFEQRAKPRPVGRQVPRETRVVLRKPGPGAEGLLPDGRVEPLRDLDERVPGPPLVCSGADDDDGTLRAVEQADERADGGGVGGCRRAARVPAAAG